jgi:hypothetical protein
MVGTPVALEFLYSDPSAMSDEAKNALLPSRTPGPELRAFGNGRQMLDTLLKETQSTPSDSYWSLENVNRPSGRKLLRLRMYRFSGHWPELPSNIFDIDPDQSYAVVHNEERMPYAPYPLIREIDVKMKNVIGTTAWFPHEVSERYFGPTGGARAIEETVTHFSDITVPPSFPVGDFSIAWLKLPQGHYLLRSDPNGSKTMLLLSSKGFVQAPLNLQAGSNRVNNKALTGGPIVGTAANRWSIGYLVTGTAGFLIGFVVLWHTIVAGRRQRL